MGSSPSKDPAAAGGGQGVQAQALVLEVADKADLAAEQKYVQHVEAIYEKTEELRAAAKAWPKWQKESERLSGGQVFKVAAALQVLHSKLLWCLDRVEHIGAKTPLLHSSQRQAFKLLHALDVALEAHSNFNTSLLVALQESVPPPPSPSGEQRSVRHHKSAKTPRSHTLTKKPSFITPSEALTWYDQAPQPGSPRIGVAQEEAAPPPPPSVSAPAGLLLPSSQQGAAQWRRHLLGRGSDSGSGGGAAEGAPAAAQQLPPAHLDMQAHDLELLLQQAAQGDAGAALLCGQVLREGTARIPQDPAAARHLLLQAAQANVTDAMLALADMSAGGEGLAVPDAQEAAAWLSRAAQLGNSQAAFLWGYMLEHGQGVPLDREAAAAWYGVAAAAGLAAAMNNLGRMLHDGLCSMPTAAATTAAESATEGATSDVPAEPAAAAAAAEAEAGPQDARADAGAEAGGPRARAAMPGDGAGSSSQAGGRHRQQALAVEWFQRAAECGSAAAWYNLGLCWQTGEGVAGGVAEEAIAAECFGKAAAGGHAGAYLKLGDLQLQHSYFSAAMTHFQAAADLGASAALLQLARLHEREACLAAASGRQGAEQRAQVAAEGLYHAAAEAGEAEAQHWVGAWLWAEGDCGGGLAWWLAAAEQGHAPALLALGTLAEEGLLPGEGRAPGLALDCYERAAQGGSEDGAAHARRLQAWAGQHAGLRAAWPAAACSGVGAAGASPSAGDSRAGAVEAV